MRQRMLAAAVLVCAAALTLGACGDDHDTTGSGTTAASPTATDFGCLSAGQTAKSITFKDTGGNEVAGYQTGTGKTGVVLSHQSNNNVCSWVAGADELAESGYRVLAVDSTGSEVPEIEGAVERLRKEGAQKVLLMGASKGGTASLAAAATVKPPVAAVVSLSGPGFYNSMDATGAIAKLTMPILLVAAQDDGQFAADARELDKLARKSKDEKLVIVPGSAHGNDILLRQPDVWDQVKAFLARYR
ncbi:alpha/beta hydrolase [Streptomyces hayashii]|uniref:alpha/beta hydrolase n=1 Tax=Streptomyces TaxID=1883 RepID=UPI002FEFEBAF